MDPQSTKRNDTINPIEKGVLVVAVLVSAMHLGLIAYSAWVLGITVPFCKTTTALFDKGAVIKHEDKHYEVHFIAKMWGFEPTRVKVPTGSTLDIFVTSQDVTHGFNVAGTNVNMMVLPGIINNTQVRFEKPGFYPIVCHEYCGAGHQNMSGLIEVSADATDISAEGLSSADSAVATASVASPGGGGRQLLEQKGCVACHSTDGTPMVGPTLKGIWGQKVELADGSTVSVDENYLKESILEPNKKVVKGFNPVMPQLPLSETEVAGVIEYIKNLK